MYRNILLPQLKRAPWRTALFLVLLAIATAFFCLSGNLYINSKQNILFAENAFSTIAILEFYGHTPGYEEAVNRAEAQTSVPKLCVVDDLNLDLLNSLPGVQSIDLRTEFCAYIPDAIAHSMDTQENVLFQFQYDLIRFTVQTEEPIVIPAQTYQGNKPMFSDAIPITVLDSANPSISYYRTTYRIGSGVLSPVRNNPSYLELSPDQEEMLRQFNQGASVAPGELVLQPGVEYLAAVEVWENHITITFDWYGAGTDFCFMNKTNVLSDALWEKALQDQPIGIWRWEAVRNDPELSAYFEEVAEAYAYTTCSFQAMTTQNLQGIPAFHQGNAYIWQGRDFSADDYAQGNAVCVISETLASTQGWSVGDRIDLSFYSYDILSKIERSVSMRPDYTRRSGGFFDRGVYEIVGIWKEKDGKAETELEVITEKIPWNTILVPTSSVENLDTVDAPASGSRLTMHLENGMMEEFLEAASQVTLSESADEVRISAFDQGYSQAQDSLQSMLGTAQFLLALSSVLLVVAGVLLAFFYTQSQKQNMALMRLLGCNRRQAGTMSLLGSLLILLPGGILGMGAGHLLTDGVASAILSSTSALDKPEYAGFREVFGVQAEVDFALAAQPAVSAAALAIAAGLFLAGCLFFILLLLRKEPREALQDK